MRSLFLFPRKTLELLCLCAWKKNYPLFPLSLSLMWRLSFSADALGGLKRGGIFCVACTYQKFSCHAIQAQDKRERHDIHVSGAIFCAKIKWDTKKTKEKKMIAIWNSQVRTFVRLTTWRTLRANNRNYSKILVAKNRSVCCSDTWHTAQCKKKEKRLKSGRGKKEILFYFPLEVKRPRASISTEQRTHKRITVPPHRSACQIGFGPWTCKTLASSNAEINRK